MKLREFRFRRTARVWLGLVVIAIAIQAAAVLVSARTTLQDVSEGLTCQCGCGLTVANCNHPTCGFAIPLRTEIQGMLDKGMSRAAIMASFRQKYGEKVLSAPTTEGFNILAWTMPFVIVLAGGVLIVLAIGRWRGTPHPSSGEPVAPSGQFDDALREQLDHELRRRL